MVTLQSTWLAIRWPSHHAKKKHFHTGLSRDAASGAGDLSSVSADLAWARLESPAVPTKPSEKTAPLQCCLLPFTVVANPMPLFAGGCPVCPAQDAPPHLPVTSGTWAFHTTRLLKPVYLEARVDDKAPEIG